MAGSFRDLEVWQEGLRLLVKIYKITAKYPSEEKYNLTSQTRSSANGVIASISEAYGRYHFADKIRVLFIGRGECYETQSHLSVALELQYISDKEFAELDSAYTVLARRVNSYIESLRKKKTN